MIRPILVAIAACCLASGALAPKAALAAKHEKAAKSEKAKPDKPSAGAKDDKAGGKLVEAYGDWTASVAQGKAKTCYALAKPKQRTPDGTRDQAYVFIADRPAEKVRGEVSITMGTPIKEGSTATAKVGKTTFDLVAVSNAFFMKTPTDDGRFVDALKRAGALVVKAPLPKGAPLVDTYSLNGVKLALDRAEKECR